VLRENSAHNGILQHVFRTCLDISTGINQDTDVVRRRKIGSNPRTFNTFESPQFNSRGSDSGSGVASTDKRVSTAILTRSTAMETEEFLLRRTDSVAGSDISIT